MIHENKDIKKILNHYGSQTQIIKCLEEMNELGAILAKSLTESEYDAQVPSEIADVFIMITQMAYLFGCDIVNDQIQFKLKRTLYKINRS